MKSHVKINTLQSQRRHTRIFLLKKESVVKYGWDKAHGQTAQLVEQRTDVPRVVGSSPTPGTNTFLPIVTLLVSEVILIIYLKHQPETPQTC